MSYSFRCIVLTCCAILTSTCSNARVHAQPGPDNESPAWQREGEPTNPDRALLVWSFPDSDSFEARELARFNETFCLQCTTDQIAERMMWDLASGLRLLIDDRRQDELSEEERARKAVATRARSWLLKGKAAGASAVSEYLNNESRRSERPYLEQLLEEIKAAPESAPPAVPLSAGDGTAEVRRRLKYQWGVAGGSRTERVTWLNTHAAFNSRTWPATSGWQFDDSLVEHDESPTLVESMDGLFELAEEDRYLIKEPLPLRIVRSYPLNHEPVTIRDEWIDAVRDLERIRGSRLPGMDEGEFPAFATSVKANVHAFRAEMARIPGRLVTVGDEWCCQFRRTTVSSVTYAYDRTYRLDEIALRGGRRCAVIVWRDDISLISPDHVIPDHDGTDPLRVGTGNGTCWFDLERKAEIWRTETWSVMHGVPATREFRVSPDDDATRVSPVIARITGYREWARIPGSPNE